MGASVSSVGARLHPYLPTLEDVTGLWAHVSRGAASPPLAPPAPLTHRPPPPTPVPACASLRQSRAHTPLGTAPLKRTATLPAEPSAKRPRRSTASLLAVTADL